MSSKEHFFTVGRTVVHRRNAKKGRIVTFTAVGKNQQYQVKWDDGLTTWEPRKYIALVRE